METPDRNHERLRFAAQPAALLRTSVLAAQNGEICGFLLGRQETAAAQIDHILAVRNADTGWDAFTISDEESRWARREATRLGLDMLAVFHSHPCGSLELSQIDRAAVIVSHLTWVVVTPGSTEGTVRAAVYEAGTARLVDVIAL